MGQRCAVARLVTSPAIPTWTGEDPEPTSTVLDQRQVFSTVPTLSKPQTVLTEEWLQSSATPSPNVE